MNTRDLALLGAGYWGKNLARNFHHLGALHTLCDLSQEILDSYGVDYHGVQRVRTADTLWTDPAITKVAIAAPAVHHYRLAKAALLAGKDTFVEKPLCFDPLEARELITLARERNRMLMVGHMLQYHPHVLRLRQLVAGDVLGPLHYITSNRLNLGKIRHEENALWSFAPHDLSVIIALAGSVLPTKVYCMGGAYLTPGVADTTITTLKFADGLRAHVYVSWLNPFKEQKLTVVGASGMAVFDDTRPWAQKLAIYHDYLRRDSAGVPLANKLEPEYALVAETEPLRDECAHFLECCRDRTPPRTDGLEGQRVLCVLRAAQASLEHDGEAQSVSPP